MATTKRIRVSIETHQTLKALGSKGESYDDVIRMLIDFIEFLDVCREDKKLLIERIKELEVRE